MQITVSRASFFIFVSAEDGSQALGHVRQASFYKLSYPSAQVVLIF